MGNTLNTIIDSSKAVNSVVNQQTNDSSFLLDGLVYLGKAIGGFVASMGCSLEPVFVVFAICGFFLLMAGFDKMGKKIVGGSVLVFTVCKVCDSIW